MRKRIIVTGDGWSIESHLCARPLEKKGLPYLRVNSKAKETQWTNIK